MQVDYGCVLGLQLVVRAGLIFDGHATARQQHKHEPGFGREDQLAVSSAARCVAGLQMHELVQPSGWILAQRQQAQQAMIQKHPDVANIVQDPEFQQWIGASKVRTRLFQAAEAYDVEAADEILSTFKELRQVKQQREVRQTSEAEVKARETALRSASVETGGSGETTRKVYRRADLIRLRMRDPAKYDSMSDEIMAAYAEGRVK